MSVGRGEEDAVFENRDTTVTDVVAFVGRISVVPELVAGASVNGPDVVRDGEVEDAVDQDG